MLQRQPSQDAGPIHEQNQDQTFSIFYIFDILKRRALYFIIPFLTILTIGSLVTIGWPAKYLSEGKILISSQEIPTDLVRPTVSTLANERIQYIQQRIMTRDNVVALAKKFNLSMGWQGRVSGSEITDFIRERTKIKPLEGSLGGERKQAIAFSVGFEYERPDVATRVANELVTMILNEDVRTRTNFASETTKFLETDVKRLEVQLSAINEEINNRQKMATGGLFDPADDGRNVAALKAQLAIKSANFSDSHPDVRSLKKQIQALENASSTAQKATPPAEPAGKTPPAEPAGKDVVAGNPNPLGIDTLLTQRAGLRQELNTATGKLAAARLGESLERGQHSERLEVIEQATLPTKPTSPNRPKIFAIVVALALMAGGGLMVGTEMLNPAIRQSADLLAFVDGQLIVAIPNIQTNADVRWKKTRRNYVLAALIALTLVALVTIFFILPPIDLLFDKIMRIHTEVASFEMEKIRQAIERLKEERPASAATRDVSGPTTLDFQSRPDLIAPSISRPYPIRQVQLNPAHLESKRVIAHDITDPRSKSFDMLRTQVLQTMEIKSWQTIGVTSPTPACGKTVVSTNLALSIARQQNRSVMLVDLDFQKPQIANYLGLNCKEGVLSVLEGQTSLAETAIEASTKTARISVLPCETAILNSSEWMASKSMDNMLHQIKRDFSDGIVIYDLPPVLTGDDVITILPRLDCILFVAAIGTTTKSDMKEVSKHLELASVVRVVLNKSSELPATYYARYSEVSSHGRKRRHA